jgi:NAD(P)-dependent dehydrogenase (short-subunit alcohol dehydrogenase family)
MKDFSGKIAVITGAGTGMGRALAMQLVAEGCDVAFCDVSIEAMEETRALCQERAVQGVRVTTFRCDVSDSDEVDQFAAHVSDAFATRHVNLLFNNAGIAGGGSFVAGERDDWERTFNVCWGGVYNGSRAFMPKLVASAEGHIVNTSSINGFFASAGPRAAHTAYSAAKFAVKGFTEALITDLRLHAPHVNASVVMPGHVGTSIILNGTGDMAGARSIVNMMGGDAESMTDDEVLLMQKNAGDRFLNRAPTSSTEAARVILDGVREKRWRILVGDDAHRLDLAVRASPERAYEADFVTGMGRVAKP